MPAVIATRWPLLTLLPDLHATRTARLKYGFVLNAEQALNDDLGLFSRLSWNDGQNEIVSTTDIDQSFSFGASLKGDAMGSSGRYGWAGSC